VREAGEINITGIEAGNGDLRLVEVDSSTWMRKALHDLCQPLTTLDCLLYLNRSSGGVGANPDPKALHEALEGAAFECSRMMAMVRAMQTRMAADEHAIQRQSTAGQYQIERMREL